MMSGEMLTPALVFAAVLLALHARADVYAAFVRGAKEGLETAVSIAPYLCAILTATALWRETGLLARLEALFAPALAHLGIPPEAAGVLLLRPLSGSAALGAVADVMHACGADSKAGRFACVVSGASETVFFTASLYLGAAGVKSARWAIPVSLAAYAVGALAAAFVT